MKITFKCLATDQKYLPPDAEGGQAMLDISAETSLADLAKRFGVPLDGSSVILVNGRTIDPGEFLQDGDVVFVFPAMAGG